MNRDRIEEFEDILAWKKAHLLCVEIYSEFNACRHYSFKDQIQRAAVSVMNNIAEGYERKGNKEFSKFLYIAKGSCGEVRSMLYLALDLGYVNPEICKKISEEASEISRMLSGFIKSLQ